MKKFVKAMTVFLALAIVFVASVVIETAAAENETGVDVAIVIDTSGSMKSTDPSRISIEAAKLFIDMLETTGSGAGIVPFSDTLGEVVDITPIESIADKEQLKSVVNNLQYSGDTDIGMAVKKGCELLKDSKTGNKKAVLFFTDGNIDLGNKRLRTDAISLQDLRDAVLDASSEGIPVYTIGLNANGSVDRNLLSDMAVQTDGRSYIVDSASDLPGIFNEIFADFINSNIVVLNEVTLDGVNDVEIPFNIPNKSVLEANIIMLSTMPLGNVSMIAPDGSALEADGKKMILSTSDQYSMLKLLMPTTGDWWLRLNGSAGCQVHVNLIFNYKVSLSASAVLGADSDGSQVVEVKAVLEKDGEPITDETLYQAFKGNVGISKDNGDMTLYPMELSGNSFIARIPVTAPGVYQIIARVDSDTLYRESSVMEVRISEDKEVKKTNEPPVFSDMFPDTVTLSGTLGVLLKDSVSLEDYVSDPEGDEITYSIRVSEPKVVKTDIKKNVLSMKAGKNGNAIITVTASDPSGASASQDIKVVVSSRIAGILPLILIPIVLIAVIVALIRLKRIMAARNAQWFGKIRWVVVNGNGGSKGIMREQIRDMGYDRGTVTLDRIIQDSSVSSMDLKKICLSMNGKTNSSIFIRSLSKNCEICPGFGGAPAKQVELSGGEFAMIIGHCPTGDITIKLTYTTN